MIILEIERKMARYVTVYIQIFYIWFFVFLFFTDAELEVRRSKFEDIVSNRWMDSWLEWI